MTEARVTDKRISAITTWVGALARGGVLYNQAEEEGVHAALEVVGSDAIVDLRRHFRRADAEETERERRAAIELCLYMAHVDEDYDASERELVERILVASDLPTEVQHELAESTPDLDSIGERLTHPTLRELMVALAWQLAKADGRIEAAEEAGHMKIAAALDVSEERARELRHALTGKSG